MNLIATSAAAIFGASIMASTTPAIANLKMAHPVKTASKISKIVVQPAATPAPAPPTIVSVQAGDNLSAIAASNNTTALRIFYANTFIASPDLIFPAQQLRMPTASETLTPRTVPANTQIATPSQPQAVEASESQVTTSSSSASVSSSGDGVWDAIAACESGGNWAIDTGNGFYGGLQFTLSSWRAVGGTGSPSQASPSEQIARGKLLQAREGWGAWPVCSVKAGV